MSQAKLSPYTTNPRRKGGRHKHHNHRTPKQLPSLIIPSNKPAMMIHANSDPISEQQKVFKSAITPPTTSAPSIASQDEEHMNVPNSSSLYSAGYQHPPPLENRNSAPEIVVLSPGREFPKIPIQQEQVSQNTNKKVYNTQGVEDRINRAKARIFQNGGMFRNGGSKDSSHYIEQEFAGQLAPSPIYHHSSTPISPEPTSTGSGHVRQKLSTRFHSAQKLNYKLAALSSFASAASANINVRRSRTFNISDVHEQLSVVGNGGCNGNIYNNKELIGNPNYYTKTLPKQMKTSSSSSPRKTQTMKKLDSNKLAVDVGTRDSNSSSSSGVCCGSYSSDITTTTTGSSNETGSVGDLGSGSSSTASSRKSSNSSSKDETTIEEDGTGGEIRTNISEDALKEIAAFESFIAGYVVQQTSQQNHQAHCCSTSSAKNCGNVGSGSVEKSGHRGCNHMTRSEKCQVPKAQLELHSLAPGKTGIPPACPRGRRMIASGGVVRTLERQKKITSMSSQNSEEA